MKVMICSRLIKVASEQDELPSRLNLILELNDGGSRTIFHELSARRPSTISPNHVPKDKILWQQGMDLKCPFCKACPDTHDHFSCPYSAIVWKEMKSKGSVAHDCHNLENIVERLAARRLKNNICQIVNKLILSATVYYVWNERNKRIFMKEAKTSKELWCSCYLGIKSGEWETSAYELS
ncbi:hypothetical protein Tco_0607162 [Tanacetum coccineum]